MLPDLFGMLLFELLDAVVRRSLLVTLAAIGVRLKHSFTFRAHLFVVDAFI